MSWIHPNGTLTTFNMTVLHFTLCNSDSGSDCVVHSLRVRPTLEVFPLPHHQFFDGPVGHFCQELDIAEAGLDIESSNPTPAVVLLNSRSHLGMHWLTGTLESAFETQTYKQKWTLLSCRFSLPTIFTQKNFKKQQGRKRKQHLSAIHQLLVPPNGSPFSTVVLIFSRCLPFFIFGNTTKQYKTPTMSIARLSTHCLHRETPWHTLLRNYEPVLMPCTSRNIVALYRIHR